VDPSKETPSDEQVGGVVVEGLATMEEVEEVRETPVTQLRKSNLCSEGKEQSRFDEARYFIVVVRGGQGSQSEEDVEEAGE
jgi:hypothetical protein